MKNEVPVRGSLKHYSFSQILTYLNRQQKTGVLTVENKDIKKNIFVKNGSVIFASSNQNEDRLGEMLIRAGKITPEQYDKSVELLQQTGKRQGAILVELGYLTPKDLFREVKRQIKEIILSLFLWEEGTFSFEETPPSTEVITLNMSMKSLISEGISRKEREKKEEENIFMQKVTELYENIERLNYYDILEVDMKDSFSEIKKAYLKMAREYHPDKHHDLPDVSMKEKLTALFTFLNKAYDTLSDEMRRKEYDAGLLRKAEKKEPDNDMIKAEEQFRRGVDEIKKGNFWGAVDFLRWAIKINPQKSIYWAHLSLALSKMPRRSKDAEEAIVKAIELEPYNANYYIHLGMIYLQAGMKKRAVHQFETALNWDPTNKKAQKELERLKSKKF